MIDHGTATLVEQFKSIASVCAVALLVPDTDTAWTEWLEFLRRESFEFVPSQFIAESWAVEQRPEPDAEIDAPGLLYPPVEIRPDPDVQLVSTTLGGVDDVCRASERLCRRVADEALKRELADGLAEPRSLPSVVTTNAVVGDPAARPGVAIAALAMERSQADGKGPTLSISSSASPDESRTVTTPDSSRTMTAGEAAKALRVSVDTLQRMRERGEIRMFKVGRRWRVLASEVFRIRDMAQFQRR